MVDSFRGALFPLKDYAMTIRFRWCPWVLVLALLVPGRAAANPDWDHTFSIVARDPSNGALGAAVSTARLAVGNRVLFVEHNVGAIATQANTNMTLGIDGLQRLRSGATAQEALDGALQADSGVKHDNWR